MRASFTLWPQMPMIPRKGRRGLVRRSRSLSVRLGESEAKQLVLTRPGGILDNRPPSDLVVGLTRPPVVAPAASTISWWQRLGSLFGGAVTWLDDRSQAFFGGPAVLALCLAACSPTSQQTSLDAASPAAAPAALQTQTFASARSAEVYRIATGDILDVNVFRQPDLSRTVDVMERVRSCCR